MRKVQIFLSPALYASITVLNPGYLVFIHSWVQIGHVHNHNYLYWTHICTMYFPHQSYCPFTASSMRNWFFLFFSLGTRRLSFFFFPCLSTSFPLSFFLFLFQAVRVKQATVCFCFSPPRISKSTPIAFFVFREKIPLYFFLSPVLNADLFLL